MRELLGITPQDEYIEHDLVENRKAGFRIISENDKKLSRLKAKMNYGQIFNFS